MFLNRCAYLLALLLLSAAAVLSGNALFALLAALCVAVAMGSLILWKIAVRRLRVRIALPESAAKMQPAISRQPNRDTAFFLLIRSVRPPNSSVERMVAADCTDAKIPICVPVIANS